MRQTICKVTDQVDKRQKVVELETASPPLGRLQVGDDDLMTWMRLATAHRVGKLQALTGCGSGAVVDD